MSRVVGAAGFAAGGAAFTVTGKAWARNASGDPTDLTDAAMTGAIPPKPLGLSSSDNDPTDAVGAGRKTFILGSDTDPTDVAGLGRSRNKTLGIPPSDSDPTDPEGIGRGSTSTIGQTASKETIPFSNNDISDLPGAGRGFSASGRAANTNGSTGRNLGGVSGRGRGANKDSQDASDSTGNGHAP